MFKAADSSSLKIAALLSLCALPLCAQKATVAAPMTRATPEVLWYKAPAPIWDDALPVGNGRLGAMIFGGANTGANNGDLQDRRLNAPLLDGSQTAAADAHLQ